MSSLVNEPVPTECFANHFYRGSALMLVAGTQKADIVAASSKNFQNFKFEQEACLFVVI